MPSHRAIQTLAVVAAVALLLGTAGLLQRLREQRYPNPPISEESLYLTSGRALQRLTAGYNTVAADLYWIRALQYFGGLRLRRSAANPPAGPPADYHLLYPLLDITTTL